MGWLSLAAGLVKLASLVMRMFERKNIEDAGMAKATLASLRKSGRIIEDAISAARYVRSDPHSLYAKRLREKYTIPGNGRKKRSKPVSGS